MGRFGWQISDHDFHLNSQYSLLYMIWRMSGYFASFFDRVPALCWIPKCSDHYLAIKTIQPIDFFNCRAILHVILMTLSVKVLHRWCYCCCSPHSSSIAQAPLRFAGKSCIVRESLLLPLHSLATAAGETSRTVGRRSTFTPTASLLHFCFREWTHTLMLFQIILNKIFLNKQLLIHK